MLSQCGAELLRTARDKILMDPSCFNMEEWHCQSVACIGGHMCLIEGIQIYTSTDERQLSLICGFGYVDIYMNRVHPLYELFFEWPDCQHRNVIVAAERINAFLWKYGYPPNAVYMPNGQEITLEVSIR